MARRMSTLETLPTKDLTAFHDQIQSRYDDFKKRGLKLDLTRGKPSSEQLDLSNGLLGLPGADDFLAFDKTDTRNYGVLQGLPELRALLAPLFGVAPAQVVLGDNSSLALMHDAIAFALLKGTVGSPRPWSPGVARRVSLPGAGLRPPFRHLPGLRHRDDPGRARTTTGRIWTRSSGWSPRTRRSRACGACRSTATRRARSIRPRPSSGWRR